MIKTFVTGSIGTNTYLIVDGNKAVVIDPGFDFEKQAIAINNEYDVVGVLLTHGHSDHIDGIRYFNCPIYVSHNDKSFLYDKELSLYSWMNLKVPYDVSKLNVVEVNDNDSIDLLDDSFKVILCPGHTSGSVSYLYKNNLFSGDTLFKEACGRTDLPTGNEKSIGLSLIKLIDGLNDNVKVYPGHGESSTIREERKNNMFYKVAKKRF